MVKIVSVVRDFDIYKRLIVDNPCLKGCGIVAYNNNVENRTIPQRYNEYIDRGDYDSEDWIVFCHEDFEFLENLEKKIKLLELDRDGVYGLVGRDFSGAHIGVILNSNKDGSNLVVSGRLVKKPYRVSTIDCMCIIVSASLFERGIRFDENLTYDLYAEDLCITARESYSISSYVIPIRAQHYSWGVIGDRFMRHYRYVTDKFRQTKMTYYTTLSRRIGNGSYDEKEVQFIPVHRYKYGCFLTWISDDGYFKVAFRHRSLCFFRKKVVDIFMWKSANPNSIYH